MMTTTQDKLFNNQTAIITGGLGDIGRATALQFAQQGAAIAICDLMPPDAADEFLELLKAQHVPCTYTTVDVSDASAVESWIDATEQLLGTPTFIIANAAVVTLAGILDITPAQWCKELSVNLDGAFYFARYTSLRLRAKELAGRIVFVGSWAGANVHAHVPAYSVSKAGMTMLMKCLALELAPYGILVNEVAPGYVDAGLSGRLWEKDPGQLDAARQKVPIRKIMSAETVADQIIYLCHPKNGHMTGATLLVDGGLSLR